MSNSNLKNSNKLADDILESYQISPSPKFRWYTEVGTYVVGFFFEYFINLVVRIMHWKRKHQKKL